MKRRVAIVLILSFCLQLVPLAITNAQSTRTNLLDEGEPQSSQSSYGWLMRPEIFNYLSAPAQRAVQLDVRGELQNRARTALVSAPAVDAAAEITPDSNVAVNNPARNPKSLTQSESSVAVNGNNVVVSFNDIEEGSGYGVSTDGGASFAQSAVPEAANSINIGDGVVARGPNGEFYYATLVITDTDKAARKSIVAVAKSVDNGMTFSVPVDASTTIANNVDFQDKEWIAVDASASSPFKGNVYVSWTRFKFSGSTIVTSRSTDGGRTFQRPVTISSKKDRLVQGSMPAVAPNGDLYIAYYRGGAPGFSSEENSIAIVKSTDGGKTFSKPKDIAKGFLAFVSLTSVSVTGVRTNSFPSMAVDGKGGVHIVYSGMLPAPARDTGTDRSDIFYLRSTDAGNTFSAPAKLNDDGGSTSQFQPSLAVSDNGTIGVRWWDRRNDPLFDSLTDLFMTMSTDGGASFSANFQVTNHNWVFGKEIGVAPGYHGDYDAMAASGNDFYVCWSDERSGDPDVYFAKLPASFNARTPDFSLSAANGYGTVAAGGKLDLPVRLLERNGFTESITLSATPPIAGLSYSFSPASARPGQTVTLSVTASSAATPGTYLITVMGTNGAKLRRTNLRVTVMAADTPAAMPINITNNRGNSNISYQDGLKVDDNGTIHVTYLDDTRMEFKKIPFDQSFINVFTSDLFYMRSTDGGRSFSTPVQVPTDSVGVISANNPIMAVDGSGTNIYIVFETGGDVDGLRSRQSDEENSNRVSVSIPNLLFISRSTDGGRTFSVPRPFYNFTDVNRCGVVAKTIAIDARGNLLIGMGTNGCIINQGGSLLAQTGFYVLSSTDQGQTFSKPVKLSGVNTSAAVFSTVRIAFDSQGAAYLSYYCEQYPRGRRANELNLQINLAVARDGINFTEQTQAYISKDVFRNPELDRPRVNARGQSIAIDKDDNIYIAFAAETPPFKPFPQRGDFDIYVIKSTDRGRTFSAPVKVSRDGKVTELEFSNIAVDSNGRVHVGWRAQESLLMATSGDGGQSFGRVTELSGNVQSLNGTPGLFDSLALVPDKRQNLIAYWNSGISGQSEIYIRVIPPQ